jgi:hypothetical protein
MMGDLSESRRRIGWFFKGGITRLSAPAPARVQHDSVQENGSESNFALDSLQTENFTTPHSRGEFLSAEFPYEIGMNSRPEPPTRTKFTKNVLKHFPVQTGRRSRRTFSTGWCLAWAAGKRKIGNSLWKFSRLTASAISGKNQPQSRTKISFEKGIPFHAHYDTIFYLSGMIRFSTVRRYGAIFAI